MADSKDPKQPQPRGVNLQIQLDDDVAQGQYINFAVVNHTPTEFVLDFIFIQPQGGKGKVHSRVVTAPVHAKRLMLALNENIKKFEKRFGEIKVPGIKPTDPVMH